MSSINTRLFQLKMLKMKLKLKGVQQYRDNLALRTTLIIQIAKRSQTHQKAAELDTRPATQSKVDELQRSKTLLLSSVQVFKQKFATARMNF